TSRSFVGVVYEAVNEFGNCSVWAHSLLVSRSGCGINKKSRSHRSAADRGRRPRKADAKRKRGSAQPQESAAINRSCRSHTNVSKRIPKRHSRATTPSAPFRNGTIFGGAATPPLQGGEYARLNSFTASIPHWERRDRMRIATWLWTVLTLGVALAFRVAPAGAQSNPIFVSLQGGAKPCFIGQTTTSRHA